MRGFQKKMLTALSILVLAGGLVLEVLGLVNLPEDANKVWRLLIENGFVPIVVIFVSLFVGYLGWLLYRDEVALRRNTNMSKKLIDFQRHNAVKTFFQPIKWHDYEHFLCHVGVSIEHASDLKQLYNHPDMVDKNIIRIESFKLLGCTKGRAVKTTGGYIQSLITGEKIPITIDGLNVNGVEIPARTYFTARSQFSCPPEFKTANSANGLPITEFRNRWREFKFVFELEGYKPFEEVFAADVVDFFLYQYTIWLQWKPGNSRAALISSQ